MDMIVSTLQVNAVFEVAVILRGQYKSMFVTVCYTNINSCIAFAFSAESGSLTRLLECSSDKLGSSTSLLLLRRACDSMTYMKRCGHGYQRR